MGEKPKNANQNRVAVAGKKPYRAPRLTVYGDLQTITKAKGGSSNDGATPPNTKK